jgi:hypothetical protein
MAQGIYQALAKFAEKRILAEAERKDRRKIQQRARSNRIQSAYAAYWIAVHASPDEFEQKRQYSAQLHAALSPSELREALRLESIELKSMAA